MSNRSPDRDYTDPREAVLFAIDQGIKDLVHTAIPGRVISYDPETKRGEVQPALRQTFTDGTAPEDTSTIVDVPFCWPTCGGFLIQMQVLPGNAVWLMFSQRGLAAWKKTLELANPTRGSFFEKEDAVAYPGFGALSVTPATTDGLSIQKEDNSVSIVIDADGNVIMNVADDKHVHLGGKNGEEFATKTFVRDHHNRHIHGHPYGPTGPPLTPSPLREGSDITKKVEGE